MSEKKEVIVKSKQLEVNSNGLKIGEYIVFALFITYNLVLKN